MPTQPPKPSQQAYLPGGARKALAAAEPHINKGLKAAALSYNKETDTAPKMTAKGRGAVAERILAVAKEHNLPIRSDADLMAILDRVEVGTEIPLEVYAVVAEIFAFLYKANQSAKSGSTNGNPTP